MQNHIIDTFPSILRHDGVLRIIADVYPLVFFEVVLRNALFPLLRIRQVDGVSNLFACICKDAIYYHIIFIYVDTVNDLNDFINIIIFSCHSVTPNTIYSPNPDTIYSLYDFLC